MMNFDKILADSEQVYATEQRYGVKLVNGVRTLDTEGMSESRRAECLRYWEATQNRNTMFSDILDYRDKVESRAMHELMFTTLSFERGYRKGEIMVLCSRFQIGEKK